MLLCTRHHALVHEGGFRIEKDYKDRWFFKRPDGRAVPACGYRTEDTTDDNVETAGEYFDAHPSAEVLRAFAESSRPFAEARMVKEPPSEIYRSAGRFAVITLPRKRAAVH